MSVSLKKGQRVELTKGRPSLKKIIIGLGWDINQYDGEADFDLDSSVFMTKENGNQIMISFFMEILNIKQNALFIQEITVQVMEMVMMR